jgi:hypothetical protein
VWSVAEFLLKVGKISPKLAILRCLIGRGCAFSEDSSNWFTSLRLSRTTQGGFRGPFLFYLYSLACLLTIISEHITPMNHRILNGGFQSEMISYYELLGFPAR